jgi:hypothetical protein
MLVSPIFRDLPILLGNVGPLSGLFAMALHRTH